MPKLNKVRKGKKFRYNVSRKRMDKKQRSTGTIKCPEIRKVWEDRKTITTNLKEIGLGWDPNKVIKIPNARQNRLRMVKAMHGFTEEDIDKVNAGVSGDGKTSTNSKGLVMKQMEADANALRESNFRLPKGIIAQLSYMMDKHKLNYNAMVFDSKNYDQWTWKQFRAKCRRFMAIPEQFNVFLESRNLEKNELDWVEYDSDGEL